MHENIFFQTAFASVYLTRKKHGPDADKKYAMKRVPILTAIEYTKAAINTCTERKVNRFLIFS